MGSWGVGVLENDQALNVMGYGITKEKSLFPIVMLLTESQYDESRMLGAAIVLAMTKGIDESIVGNWYDYEKWFQGLKKHKEKLIRHMALEARSAIVRSLSDEEINRWFEEETRQERKRLLTKMKHQIDEVIDMNKV